MSASVRKTFSVEDLTSATLIRGQDTGDASLGLGGALNVGIDHDVPPLRTCGVTRNLYNLLVLSMAFFFIFFPFITAQAFATPLLGYLGSMSLIVLYVTHACMHLPSILCFLHPTILHDVIVMQRPSVPSLHPSILRRPEHMVPQRWCGYHDGADTV